MNSKVLLNSARCQKPTEAFTPLETIVRRKKTLMFLTGFTLVELLVAISIFAAVVTVVYTTLYTGIKAYQHTQAQLELDRDINLIAEKLSVELRNSVEPYALMFPEGGEVQLGDDHSLSFFTIHNTYTEGGMKKVVARMSYVFHDGTLFKKQQLDGDAFLDEHEFDEEALLTNIESFYFSYLYKGLAAGEDVVHWQSNWPCKKEMPHGVRMEVVWRDPSTDTRVNIERYIVIEQGVLSCAEAES